MYFDTHAHLDDERFDEDREELISGLPGKGISYVLNAGSDMETSEFSIRLADQYGFIYAAVGVHPHHAADMTDVDLYKLKELAKHGKVVAIGEIGLDYYYDFSPREVQIQRFQDQIDLASELRLPIIIHDREAHGDMLDVLQRNKDKLQGGVMHAYSGSWEMAKTLMDLGFYIALGGSLTFKNAKRAVEVAQKINLDRLLIETDSPYLTPVPHRGKRNNPAYVALVAEKIAEIRGMRPEEIGAVTTENARRLFRIQ